MTGDVPTWASLFERAPAHISETTVREVLADVRAGEDDGATGSSDPAGNGDPEEET